MTREKPEEGIEQLDALEIWQNARKYAALIGEIPTSFSSISRSLAADGAKGTGELSQGTRFLVKRLLKGGAILAPFFFMSKNLFPDEFENRVYISSNEMIDLYKPFDLASFITIVYLARKFSAVCTLDEWKHVSASFQKLLNIGGQLGASIPAIGIGTSLLVSSISQLSLGVFLLHDRKGFIDYRRQLKSQTHKLNHQWELSRWGCTSAHVGALFIQIFGLGVPAAHGFLQSALHGTEGIDTETDNEIYRFRIARVWFDSLLAEEKIPAIHHRGRYYPEGGEVEYLLDKTKEFRKMTESDEGWLAKTKDAVSPELTPLLFRPGGPLKADAHSHHDEEGESEDIFGDDHFEPS